MSRYPDDQKAIKDRMKATGKGFQRTRKDLQKEYAQNERNRKHGATDNN